MTERQIKIVIHQDQVKAVSWALDQLGRQYDASKTVADLFGEMPNPEHVKQYEMLRSLYYELDTQLWANGR